MSDVKAAQPAISEKAAKPEEKLDMAKLVESIAISVASAMRAGQPAAPVYEGRGSRNYGPVCGVCDQYVSACNNEHESMSVYTVNYPEFGQFFQGVFINGKKYLSNDENHFTTPVTSRIRNRHKSAGDNHGPTDPRTDCF